MFNFNEILSVGSLGSSYTLNTSIDSVYDIVSFIREIVSIVSVHYYDVLDVNKCFMLIRWQVFEEVV